MMKEYVVNKDDEHITYSNNCIKYTKTYLINIDNPDHNFTFIGFDELASKPIKNDDKKNKKTKVNNWKKCV